MKLEFPKDDAGLAQSLSAVVRVGDDLWVGSDEGTKAMCLRRDKGDRSKPPFRRVDEIDLVQELDLPGKTVDKGGGLPEVDLEGMDWDAQGGYLWMVGSHSLKRTAPKFATKKGSPIDDAENVARLSVISADGNRFLLGRLPLKVDAKERSRVIQRGAYAPDRFGARLPGTERTSELLDALHDDPILKQFLMAGRELPGKDNGVDIEGLAWDAKEKRLIVGLRGPVLRGMAMLLELKVTEEFAGADGVGRLRLQRIGAHGEHFRRHFLDLDGLSVRDLCFRGNDLLVLAGPTMPIDWPVTIYRWQNGRSGMDGRQRFVWQESGELGLWVRAELKDAERKHDRPEALTLWKKNEALVVCDAPSGKRFDKPATVAIDKVVLPKAT